MSNTSADLQRIFANQRDMRESFIKRWIYDVEKAKLNIKNKKKIGDIGVSGKGQDFEGLSF